MDDKRELQRGWTTGACATAAAKAAFIGLITKKIPSEIRIKLPGGQIPIFKIIDSKISKNPLELRSVGVGLIGDPSADIDSV